MKPCTKRQAIRQSFFQATKKANPTSADHKTIQRKIAKADSGFKQTNKQIETVVRKISLDLLSDDEAKSILTELRAKKQYFSDQIDELKAELKPLVDHRRADPAKSPTSEPTNQAWSDARRR